jgi:hypothetical protein
MEHEPPPVRVVDPSLGTTDLVGDDRPRRGGALAVGLVVVLLTVVALSTLREDKAADRVAVDELRLSAAESPRSEGSAVVRVAVRNDGPTSVQVLSARLVAEGYVSEAVDQTVAPGSRLVLSLRDSATCAPTLPAHPVEAVELLVRTQTGTTVTRSVALSPSAYREVNHTARERCGYLPADEAFSFEGVSSRLETGSATIRARVANGSLLPMQLSRLLPMTGLSLITEPKLPLEVPVQPKPLVVGRFVDLRLTLTVDDCSTFLQSYNRGAGRRELVRGWLVQEEVSVFEVPVLSVDPASCFRPVVDPEAIATHLLGACEDH